MSREVADRCLALLESCPSVQTLDVTGGAPELCDQFRYLVERGRALGKEVIDRCNLTVILEPGQEVSGKCLGIRSYSRQIAVHCVTCSLSLPPSLSLSLSLSPFLFLSCALTVSPLCLPIKLFGHQMQ